MKAIYKPGTDNCPAGRYREVDSSGVAISDGRECTIQQGDRLPPTSEYGSGWIPA